MSSTTMVPTVVQQLQTQYSIRYYKSRPLQISTLLTMLDLPNQAYWFSVATYTQLVSLTLIWNISVGTMSIALLFLILFFLKLYHLRKSKQNYHMIRPSLISNESDQSSRHRDSQSFRQDVAGSENLQSKKFKVINILTSVMFYLFWVSIAGMYLALYIFGFMGEGVSHDVLAVAIMVVIILLPTVLWKLNTKVKPWRELRREGIFTACMLLLWTAACIIAVIFGRQTCVCQYNTQYGANFYGQFIISTRFSRSLQFNKICPDDSVCHIYATLPQQTDQQVFINVHTGFNLKSIEVILSKGQSKQHKISYQPFNLSYVEENGQRNVHSLLFSGLEPNSLYQLSVVEPKSRKQLYSSSYKTVPGANCTKLKIAMGGDVGMNSKGMKLTETLIAYQPDLLIIGGDIAYDNAMRSCYHSWDNFYDIFDELNRKLGRVVPMILSVGNHDVGFNALAQVHSPKEFQTIPLFFGYNPQHSTATDIKDRQSKHYHLIGPTVHFSLDSNYVESFESQTFFIKAISEQYRDRYKFANYHNPIYASCLTQDNTDHVKQFLTQGANEVVQKGMKHWVPLFEQYQFVAAFEHHNHHLKVTKPLLKDKVDQKGVLFIGDGSWGVDQPACSKDMITPRPQIFQFFDRTQEEVSHVWQITFTKDTEWKMNYTAVGLQGTQLYSNTTTLPELKGND